MKRPGLLRGLFVENGTYKLVALFITLSLWVVILERKEVVLVKSVGLEFILPPEHVLLSSPVDKVQFKVRGPRISLKKLMDNTDRIHVDLSSAEAGKTVVRLYDDLIQLPPGVRVLGLTPSRVTVEIDRAVSKAVPIRVSLPNDLMKELKLKLVSFEPKTVDVRGAEPALRELREIVASNLGDDLRKQKGTEGAFDLITTVEVPDAPGLLPTTKKSVVLRFEHL